MNPAIPLLREQLADAEASAADAARQEAHWRSIRIRETSKVEHFHALLALFGAEGGTGKTADSQTETSAEAAPDDVSGQWESVPEPPPVESEFELSPAPARTLSKRERVRQETINLLRLYDTRHRRQILDHLIATGVMGHEKAPMASLAAYLSNYREMFVPDGRGNFTLRRNAEAPHGAAQPSSPAEEANPT